MPTENQDLEQPRWIERYEQIDNRVEHIEMPDVDGDGPAQDHEWCEAIIDGVKKRVRFHDYHELYKVPGFYEKLFYEELKCCSPSRVASLLSDVIADFEEDDHGELRVLDVGAGNGMVGDELHRRGVKNIVGIDIIPEAKDATHRDRPEVYEDYYVTDLTDLPEQQEEALREKHLNCLSSVAALGFGDIPPKAFLKALDLISTPGWMAFNIKEDFIDDHDASGFCKLIRQLSKTGVIQIQAYRRYQHRLSLQGKPLHYVAVVARKLQDVTDDVMEYWSDWQDQMEAAHAESNDE
jgi:SAM-dependent methyltransferase